jgi:hypothetical protein
LIVNAEVNGNLVRALVDSGSLADFILTTLADQLKLKLDQLAKSIPCTMAASGSRTMIQGSTQVEFKLEEIIETCQFDIMNLERWDLILGTPFLYQHSVSLGFNPSHLSIDSCEAQKMEGDDILSLSSTAADILESKLEKLRNVLRKKALELCHTAEDTPLSPFCAVNHTIPLIDESKVYHWCSSRCPEPLRPFWNGKCDEYVKSGQWRFQAGTNASPMMIVPKLQDGPNGEKRWRTVADKHEANANTKKLASLLETILTSVLRHKYCYLIDGKDAYEQIQVIEEHGPHTLFNTPDGTMESLVLQQGDCNGGATYQALMNHIFGTYIGVFMDVCLDDIIIYSNTVNKHVEHICKVFVVLKRERLYLTSPDKLQFFVKKLKFLGHIIDEKGLVMDLHKVDTIKN